MLSLSLTVWLSSKCVIMGVGSRQAHREMNRKSVGNPKHWCWRGMFQVSTGWAGSPLEPFLSEVL